MATALLSSASNVVCPHGGSVQFQQADLRVHVSGTPVVHLDVATVSGCQFFRPCTRVVFSTGTLRAFAGKQALLTAASNGMCEAADGTPNGPVQVLTSDVRVSGS